MNKKYLFIMCIALIIINILTLIRFYQYKKQCIIDINFLANRDITGEGELRTYRVNFKADILNSNIRLNEKIEIKDSHNNNISLKDIFKSGRKQVIVCRISETNCESCVSFSTKMLRQWIDTTNISDVLFLGTYNNNRIFNKLKSMYGIEKFSTFNIQDFNIPAEENGYPYYFVLDSALNISNLFFPDKSTPEITKRYLEIIQKRYFENHNIDFEKE